MAQFGSSREELRGHGVGVEALVWGISKLRDYLDDNVFAVFTDYIAFRGLFEGLCKE